LSGAAARAWHALFAEAGRRGLKSASFECMAPAEFLDTLSRIGMTPRTARPIFGALRDDLEAAAASAEWYLTDADEDE
jgi:hypothetical protein